MPRSKVAHFKVVFEPEPDGSAWNVSIPAVKGCCTYGRSLAEARANIREALSLYEEELDGKADAVAASAVFEEEIRWPRAAREAARRIERARARIEAEEAKVNAATREITGALSLRDAGELLGLSHEGVRKMLKVGQNPGRVLSRC
jgi:predicted RNase H-like HicB family nuclease